MIQRGTVGINCFISHVYESFLNCLINLSEKKKKLFGSWGKVDLQQTSILFRRACGHIFIHSLRK